MRCLALSPRRAAVTLTAVLLAGGSARSQTTVTPRAAIASPAFVSPISPLLFGPPAYPFRATAPSSTTPAPTAAQISGISHAPSLSPTPAPLSPVPGANLLMHSQPAIGPFVGFASPSALMQQDSLLPGSGYRPEADNRAHIWLRVPADAKVWFDGQATTQIGKLRLYNSPKLTSGKEFIYEVRVLWMKDGKPIEEKRRIAVHAKDWLRFDLTQPSPQ